MREKPNGTKRSTGARPVSRGKGTKRSSRGRTDWARVEATTDKQIALQIARNPDDVEFTDAMLAEARWVMPEKKVPISFRVDPDVLAFFKAGGGGYQSRMNAVLRGYMHGQERMRGARAGKRTTG